LRSDGALHQAFGFAFQLKPRVLMGLAASNCSDALHEIKDAFRLAILFAQNGLDDLRCLRLGKPTFAQEVFPVIVRTGNDPLPWALMPATNGAGEELAKLVSAGAASCAKR
jgi:hypothetical protein